MSTSSHQPSPIDVFPDNTVGEDTEKNYRYQHAYGVILLAAAACNKLSYVSLYAEHHEDFLCERSDNLFDGYQVKTRKPEEGSWDLADEALKKSIKRFVELNKKFGEYICSLNFVSNADYSDPGSEIKDQTKLRRSPLKLLEAIGSCNGVSDVSSPFNLTLQELQGYCKCSPEELFTTLKKVYLIPGPERNSFDAELTTDHLGVMRECSSLSIPVVNTIRDELIHIVWHASHKVEDPSKHWYPLNKKSSDNPRITAKRVSVDIVHQTIHDRAEIPFRYYDSSTINLGSGKGNLWKLRKKMEKGEIHSQIQTMERRSLSAEQKLMEYAIRYPSKIDATLAQLEGVVQGECDEAYLHALLSGKSIGPPMLVNVYKRLHEKADLHSDYVLRQPYESSCWNRRFINRRMQGLVERTVQSGRCRVSFNLIRAIAGTEINDDIHLGRLLLLLLEANKRSSKAIEGITKLAKMDFLLRYPNCLERALAAEYKKTELADVKPHERTTIESKMIRFKYGPWDARYRRWLSILESRGLITTEVRKKTVYIGLTEVGQEVAEQLAANSSFMDISSRSQLVVKYFGSMSATGIKDFVYKVFPELETLKWGEDILL